MAKTRSKQRGIRPRGDGWQVDVSHRGKRRTATCDTYEDAVNERIKLMAELRTDATGEQLVAEAWSLSEALQRTIQVAWTGLASEVTATRNVEAAIEFFGADTPLNEIDTLALDDWVASLREQSNSDGTINRKLAPVSKVFSVALDRGGVRAKPKFPRCKEAVGRIRFLTGTEEDLVLHDLGQWGKDEERDAVAVLIDTGIRTGELLRLETRDVDFKGGVINIWQTKAGLPRSVPMTQRVRETLGRAVTRNPAGRLYPHSKQWLRHPWADGAGRGRRLRPSRPAPHLCVSPDPTGGLPPRGPGVAWAQDDHRHHAVCPPFP